MWLCIKVQKKSREIDPNALWAFVSTQPSLSEAPVVGRFLPRETLKLCADAFVFKTEERTPERNTWTLCHF